MVRVYLQESFAAVELSLKAWAFMVFSMFGVHPYALLLTILINGLSHIDHLKPYTKAELVTWSLVSGVIKLRSVQFLRSETAVLERNHLTHRSWCVVLQWL